ncbi:unnamed protein product [Rotaria magnacalcarata]|uniref:Chitin-binding type-2 domain-containing protein n=1 Tax=Rotaria magnacalcarata TaxID=392030 RepID=A0A815PIZ3_9BILA|nr:unnamed protein product [Rotaria magnacalcarata]CAF1634362.1 unnamed protein product [Rotaria magnacalcarata]CAF4969696.1 unnamed protein product [Rotaria magnacalcarata]CAF5018608.1 unnamed protein product [Rotaria magnacalcarata]
MTALLLSSIIFMPILFIEIIGEDAFDCTGYDDDSFHPIYDTNDCRHYWHCIYVGTSYMRAVKRICPAGTEFDFQLKECEISSLVDCVKVKSNATLRTSISTKQSVNFLTRKPSATTNKSTRKTVIPQQFKVLSITTSPIAPIFSFEQLIKSLNAIAVSSKHQTVMYTIHANIYNTINQSKYSQSMLVPTTTTTTRTKAKINFLTSNINQKHIHHRRENITINVLTSNEHKIRRFSINQTHGLFIHCNEVRRRHLRDLIFRTTTTTYSLEILNSSSKTFHHGISSLKIFIMSFLFLQKISD